MFISLGGNCSIAYQLNKYDLRTHAYPFDWCKINSKQLLQVLKSNFKNFSILEFKKYSENHKLIADGTININQGSVILKNKYNIQFAHELKRDDEILEYQNKLSNRIHRFNTLKIPTFIRIETENLNNDKIKIYQNIEIELSKYFDNYKLILISKFKYESEKIVWYPLEFTSDWTYSNLDWETILME